MPSFLSILSNILFVVIQSFKDVRAIFRFESMHCFPFRSGKMAKVCIVTMFGDEMVVDSLERSVHGSARSFKFLR